MEVQRIDYGKSIDSRLLNWADVRFYIDMDYKIREIKKNEYPILSDFLV